MNLVLYHGGACLDGFCAAWVVRQQFPDAEFKPVNYGDVAPNVSGMDVMIVDFSWPRDVLMRMKETAKSLVVLDHHKTAQSALEGLPFCIFDLSKSGARLAWEFTNDAKGGKAPWFVDYIEDGDLWNWALPKSREVKAALQSYPLTWEMFDKLAASTPKDAKAGNPMLKSLMEQGEAILRFKETLIAEAVHHAQEVKVGGHKVLLTNVSVSSLISDVGHRLAIDRPFGVTWFSKGNQVVYSLRSTPAGVDVGEVAKGYGGGGHPNAAGFTIMGAEHSFENLDGEDVKPKEDVGPQAPQPLRHDVVIRDGHLVMKFGQLVHELVLDRGTGLMLASQLRSKAASL